MYPIPPPPKKSENLQEALLYIIMSAYQYLRQVERHKRSTRSWKNVGFEK